MKEGHLIVSETFYSIQGEGPTVGIPAVFLRLAGCNLLCEGKGWRCDTIEVWQKGKSTPFQSVLSNEFVTHLHNGAHLVITGGEPMVVQDQIFQYLLWFKNDNFFYPYVEIETNGTIVPDDQMMFIINQWNCSPKLPNSGEQYNRRVNEVAINKIATAKNFVFKFVIADEKDLMDIYDDYDFLQVSSDNLHRIMLMPAGATQAELALTMPIVAELCKTSGYRFSPRMHIDVWNKKTGV